jgi:heptosyltransferase II
MVKRLIVFAPNWLGDAVMALPALAGVRRALPAADITVAARASVAPLFTMVAGVSSVVTLDRSRADLARVQGSDAALLLPNSWASAWLAWRAGIAERWGYRADGRAVLLTRAITPPVRLHQSDFYRRLVDALGFPTDAGPPRLEPSDAVRQGGRALLLADSWDGSAPLVAVAAGAAFGGAKKWPTLRFAETVTRLAADGVRAVLVGTAADRGVSGELLAALGAGVRPIDLVGRTDLRALAGVLVHCRALVTNDSGAMHVAAALGVHTTAMFGSTNERETAPLGAGRHTVLTHDVWCRPCMLRECPLTHRCMTGITVDAVLDATRSHL